MEYHLNREIRLVHETEHVGLYKWYLQEFTHDGSSLSSKLIPWAWGFDFTASNLQYITTFKLENWKEEKSENTSVEYINFKLQPQGSERLAVQSAPRFYMFGTDREIKDFSLTVRCLQSDEEFEYCRAMGVISYTSDIDFRNHTTNDWLGFEVGLKPKNFSSLRLLAQQKNSDGSLWLNIRGPGFYSEWSPTISTSRVKVLTEGNEHKIIQADEQISPPRLGSISEFSLSFARKENLQPWDFKQESVQDDLKNDSDHALEQENAPNNPDSLLFGQVRHLQVSLANIQKALWLIAALLILSLFIH